MTQPRLYTDLADWFHLLTAPADYEGEAAEALALLRGACDAPPRTLLELGSGGGNMASHLKHDLELTLTDLSPAMLAISHRLNPGCTHLPGDMRTMRLGNQFDAVLAHDAISYMTTEDDLRAAIATAFAHCRPGGAALFLPDHVAERFVPSTSHHGHDDGRGRGLRYVEWAWDPDPSDTACRVAYSLILREGDSVRFEGDVHEVGVFPVATWLRLLAGAGFDARCQVDSWDREIFVARKPA